DYLALRCCCGGPARKKGRPDGRRRDARKMTKRVARIEVLDQSSAVNNIPRDPARGNQIETMMNLIDKSRM
ncbi:MAG: hypothetical protein WCB91_05750, partial [Halobacteriota archaeon]